MTTRLYSHIYPWLQTLPVSFHGALVNARGLGDPVDIASTDLPVRILMPSAGGSIERMDVTGRHRAATWIIPERFLLASVAAGRQLQDYGEWLVQYMVAFEDALAANASLWTPSMVWTVEFPVRTDAGEYEWPVGSGRYYFGVHTQITIRELFS